jgi:SNF2 family DNA or RNA helicase
VKLRPYQESAADFIYSRDRSLILAPVGAGKTAITATAMADLTRDGIVKRWLVLAPKRVAQHVWPVEIPKWAQGLSFAVCAGTPTQRLAALNASVPVVIINYDNLQWLAEQELDFDGIVFDELTRLKSPSGKRFKALDKVIEPMKVRIGLTGSFTSNGLEDVFGQVKIVNQSLLGRSKGAFMQQYFICTNPEYGEFMPRPGALARVMERIKPATFVLESGAYELPALNIAPMTCEMELSAYKKMKADLVLEHADGAITAVNAAVATGKLLQLASGWAYDTQSTPDPSRPGKWNVVQTPVWFSGAKFDLLDELIQENQHAPMLVWYSFKEQLAELRRRYPHLQTLDDPNAIERWNAGKIELLAAHPMSASHGLNLQSGGSKMVFITLPWSLELYEQAIGRLHRSGQTQPVWVYVLLTKGTVDERVFQGLTDKKDMSALALEVLRG